MNSHKRNENSSFVDIFFVEENADKYRKQGPCRSRHSHRPEGVGKHDRSQIGAWETDGKDGNDIMDEGENGFPVSCKITTETEVHAGNSTVDDVRLKVIITHADHIFFARYEESHDFSGFEVNEDDTQDAECDADGNAVIKRFSASAVILGACILSGGGRDSGHHGRRNEEEEADDFFYNTYGSSRFYAKPIGNGCDGGEGNLNQSILTGNRKADG